MDEQQPFEFKVGGKVVAVGPNPQPPNKVVLTLKNLGGDMRWTGREPPKLYIDGLIGTTPDALFASVDDARGKCKLKINAQWLCRWVFPTTSSFSLELVPRDNLMLAAAKSLEVELDTVISQTSPGEAKLTFRCDRMPQTLKGTVAKQALAPGILYFLAEPAADVLNLPNSSVVLSWGTHELDRQELQADGNVLPYDFASDQGKYTLPTVDRDRVLRLKGYLRNNTQSVDRELTIRVLKPGWHGQRLILFPGDPGYVDAKPAGIDSEPTGIDLEPTLLVSGGDRLYGVFRHDVGGGENAHVFETSQPFAPWIRLTTRVDGQRGAVPQGFATSPGVWWNGQLWLVGGSQIDPDVVSNRVWSLDPRTGTWLDAGPAGWSARMGHAVLVYQGALWVLGGRDESGNARNDIWKLSLGAKTWQRQPDPSWAPRCLFGAGVFGSQLWIYGGASEPFSQQLFGDMHMCENGVWSAREVTGVLSNNGMPIAAALHEFSYESQGSRLCLLGLFRAVGSDASGSGTPMFFSTSRPAAGEWAGRPGDALKDWGEETDASYRLTVFGDRMLIATALRYDTRNPEFKIYVRP